MDTCRLLVQGSQARESLHGSAVHCGIEKEAEVHRDLWAESRALGKMVNLTRKFLDLTNRRRRTRGLRRMAFLIALPLRPWPSKISPLMQGIVARWLRRATLDREVSGMSFRVALCPWGKAFTCTMGTCLYNPRVNGHRGCTVVARMFE